MTKAQLTNAFTLARTSEPAPSRNALPDDLSIFVGFGLHGFGPITCTLAALIRWQCICFDGSVDAVALDEIARFGRQRFNILE